MQVLKHLVFGLAFIAAALDAPAQSINSGTVTGVVTDQSGAVISKAKVQLKNQITGYQQSATTTATGEFRFNNIPQNNYHLTAEAPGFAPAHQDVNVRSSLPITANLSLKVASEVTTMTVQADESMIESDPSAHQDVDRSSFLKLPNFNPGGHLIQPTNYTTVPAAPNA